MTFTNLEPRAYRLSELIGRVIDTDLTELWMKAIKSVLSLLILTILIALTGGVIKTFLDIRLWSVRRLKSAFGRSSSIR